MSEFTGKCDFCDELGMAFDHKESIKVYHNYMLLNLESSRDFIPLYPYIVGSSSTVNGEANMYLSDESYIDTEERESLSWRVRDLVTACKSAKRHKVEFNYEYCKNYAYDWRKEKILYKQIIDIIIANPKIIKFPTNELYNDSISDFILKTYFYNIHTAGATAKRERLLDYAADNGFGEIYHLRGEKFLEAAYNQMGANDNTTKNLVDAYFSGMCESSDIASNFKDNTYIANPILNSVMSKVNMFYKMEKEYKSKEKK